MATATFISLETYLTTSYEPHVDYVDGVLVERNVGEYDHSAVQRAILIWFYLHERDWRIRSIQEQRTRVASTRVRIPDISVFSREIPIEQVFTRPQLIAIEVLSPEDRHSRIDERLRNLASFGVANLWVIDPETRTGWDCSDGSWVRKQRFEVANSPIYLSIPPRALRKDRRRQRGLSQLRRLLLWTLRLIPFWKTAIKIESAPVHVSEIEQFRLSYRGIIGFKSA
jgi:Uma2 family endonuclease